MKNLNNTWTYKPGLDKYREDVISAHFMHEFNQNKDFSMYSEMEFETKSLTMSADLFFKELLPSLLNASNNFIKDRIKAIKIRARENFLQYQLKSGHEITVNELIVETLLDRQFLKGSKSNISRLELRDHVKKLTDNNRPIKMVIPALPYKSPSPLKTRGTLPGLAEINFLLGLTEIVKVIEIIYKENKPEVSGKMAEFTVVSDGSRFNEFLNEPKEQLLEYQRYLNVWIQYLGISDSVKIIDYQDLLKNFLGPENLEKKKELKLKVYENYKKILGNVLDPNNMAQSMKQAAELDLDIEEQNREGRFVSLFKSLIYSMRYKCLSKYFKFLEKEYDYKQLYKKLTENLFSPYMILKNGDVERITHGIMNSIRLSENEIFEYLRQAMLREAWEASIAYISEIRSDRDLELEPIILCLPDYIRWTIHAKAGQLAILTTTAEGDPVQPWHGIAVFKMSQQSKIKLYTLPVLSLEGINSIPVLLSASDIPAEFKEYAQRKQPIFYIYPDIKFNGLENFVKKIDEKFTRSRKS